MSTGALVKLMILPFKNEENLDLPSFTPFVCPFNPETFSVSQNINYAKDATTGNDGKSGKYSNTEPRTLSFDIFLDGTGASGIPIPVMPQIEHFQTITGFQGDIHQPGFFIVGWGPFLMRCRLKSYTINYKLFGPSGTPLRAIISTSWEEFKPIKWMNLISNLMSPDVTHQHQVIEGEHLANITYEVYKDTRYYLQVAEKNGLNNLRELPAGTDLELNPLK